MDHREPATTWSVVPLRPEHVPAAVEVHRHAFPGFFLSFLGPRFLREFYGSFLADAAGIGLVVEDDSGRVLGTVVGPLRPEGFFGRLVRRRWWALAAASLVSVLKRPSIAPRLLRALVYRGDPPPGPPRSLLSSVCVSPRAQGKGIGAALVRAWLHEARTRGSTGCYLTADADDNESTNRFYQGLGWTLESSFVTPQGRRMHRYVLDFHAPRKAA